MSSFEYSSSTKIVSLPNGDLPRIRLDLYFDKKSKDFGLLMDLLAEASGLVQSLRILSMFDRGFQKLWNAANVRIHVDQQMLKSDKIGAAGVEEEEGREEDVSIIVSWDDCDMADYFCQNNPSTVMEYTAEISPETEIPIKSFQYYKSLGFLAGDIDKESLVVRKSGSLLNESNSLTKYSARFDGLKPGTSYDIHIATELDGKTVVQTKHTFKTVQIQKSRHTSSETEQKKETS